MLRGDLPRLSRTTSILTASPASEIKRSKPLKYAYEKEIVLYAHHKKLDYFSTECIYSPEAFRGSARALIKNLERVRPSAILDIVRSGEDMAKLVPAEVSGNGGCGARGEDSNVIVGQEEDGTGGCGSANGRSSGGEMASMELKLKEDAAAERREMEITGPGANGQRHDRNSVGGRNASLASTKPVSTKTPRKLPRQQMGKCKRCGYLASQEVCKACMLLEGLNRNRPKVEIEIAGQGTEEKEIRDHLKSVSLDVE